MLVLIIGASRGVGLETARQAVAAGHQVRAFARSARDIGGTDRNLEKIGGDALNSADVSAALVGVNVVIQTLGVGFGALFQPIRLFSAATQVLIDAMHASGVKRLISLTGFGAGDSGRSVAAIQRLPFNLVFGRAYQDKSRQERLIKESSLDWTIVRPGVLTHGRRTGRYQVLERSSEWRNGIISRADVADFLVRQIEGQSYLRKDPVLVN
jgi:putative NADH-flavin reductase